MTVILLHSTHTRPVLPPSPPLRHGRLSREPVSTEPSTAFHQGFFRLIKRFEQLAAEWAPTFAQCLKVLQAPVETFRHYGPLSDTFARAARMADPNTEIPAAKLFANLVILALARTFDEARKLYALSGTALNRLISETEDRQNNGAAVPVTGKQKASLPPSPVLFHTVAFLIEQNPGLKDPAFHDHPIVQSLFRQLIDNAPANSDMLKAVLPGYLKK